MPIISLVHLITLAALWGGSFLFIRICASALGPALLMELRVLLAAIFLLLVSWLVKKRSLEVRKYWKHYLILGIFNSALPFLLYAYAAQALTASLLSVLNALAPIWGAVVTALYSRTMLSSKSALGLTFGVAGVAVLVGFDAVTVEPEAWFAVLCGVLAALCYGISGTYAHHAVQVPSFSNAHGSMWAASLVILPLLLLAPDNPDMSLPIVSSVLALGVLCTGVAYLLYFRLIEDVGSASALTVTFLIPVFGILWGYLLLDEEVGWHTYAGSTMVVLGTALVTNFSPSVLWKRADV